MYLGKAITEKDPSLLDPKNPAEFAELVNLHHRELLIYARALTQETNIARDIVQEAFIVAYEKVNTFDVTRDFSTWVRGIVRNKWREWYRKNKRYEFTDSDLSLIEYDVSAWQSERATGNSNVFEALELCLERLPENLREAIQAFYYEGQSGDEASESLGVAPAAIRKRLQRARTLLKECVDGKLGKEGHALSFDRPPSSNPKI